MNFFDIDPRFRSPILEEMRLKKLAENMVSVKVELTNEMLEQIRAVVREELRSAMKPPITWSDGSLASEDLTERLKEWKPVIHIKEQTTWTLEDEDTFLREVLRSRLSLGLMSLPEYRAELARLDKQKLRDVATEEGISADGKVSGVIYRGGKITELGKQVIEEGRKFIL